MTNQLGGVAEEQIVATVAPAGEQVTEPATADAWLRSRVARDTGVPLAFPVPAGVEEPAPQAADPTKPTERLEAVPLAGGHGGTVPLQLSADLDRPDPAIMNQRMRDQRSYQ